MIRLFRKEHSRGRQQMKRRPKTWRDRVPRKEERAPFKPDSQDGLLKVVPLGGLEEVGPNMSYLKERKDRIRGVIITHGHLDHIGAIPYLIHDLGNPPIYTMPLTRGIILKRQ